MRKTVKIVLLLCCIAGMKAQNYATEENISYIDPAETDAYRQQRCKLDIYRPLKTARFPTVVWFHGGGLEGGEKFIPEGLKNKNIAVVAVNYRLSPAAKNPAYTVDAAEATAWVFKNIEKYGGDPDRIYISGHSAGGYLALLITFDKKYLAACGVDADRIKGLIPVSGQTNTHYTIRSERGLPKDIPVIDEYAPLNRVRKGIPPTVLITGDRNLELLGRFEENLHLKAILKSQNVPVELYELQGFDHGNVVMPAMEVVLRVVGER